jgi:enoyl-CoA hydratase/carnithine racemase
MWQREFSTLLCELDGDGVLTVTLNRPERMNAFTVTMCNELVDAFGRASADDAVRALVVTGAGRAFCAGMDLGGDGHDNVFGLDESLQPTLADLEQRYEDDDVVHGLRDTGGRVTLALLECLKPVIAAVNGVAVGVGATMTLAMDLRFATAATRYGFVFGKIGIVPDACSSWFLPRIVGLPKALEWVYSGELIDAPTALATGLVNRIVPPEQLLAEAQALARRIARERSAAGTALTRQMLWRLSAEPDVHHVHRIESLLLWHQTRGDGKEGVRAFLEKRPAQFASRASELPPPFPWWTSTRGTS